MKRLAFVSLLIAAFVATGCIKTASDSAVKGDGTATVKLSIGYNKEVIENFKSMIEAQGGGEEDAHGSDEMFKKFEAGFDDKKIGEEWKKLGLEVAKASSSDKDGWKMVEIEGSVKNLVEYNRKHAAALKKLQDEAGDNPMEAMSSMDPGKLALPALPRFYKTDQPNVAKVVLNPQEQGAASPDMPDLEEMSDEEREQMEMGLDQMRAMFGLDDMKVRTKIKLPGKILSVSNAKQEGDDVMVFELLGSNMTVETFANMAKTKGMISATLQFDPETFKIPLEDEPKAESKPAKPKDEAKPEKKDEEEKKKKDEDE